MARMRRSSMFPSGMAWSHRSEGASLAEHSYAVSSTYRAAYYACIEALAAAPNVGKLPREQDLISALGQQANAESDPVRLAVESSEPFWAQPD